MALRIPHSTGDRGKQRAQTSTMIPAKYEDTKPEASGEPQGQVTVTLGEMERHPINRHDDARGYIEHDNKKVKLSAAMERYLCEDPKEEGASYVLLHKFETTVDTRGHGAIQKRPETGK